MRRIILIIFLTVVFGGVARAQSIESFKTRLAQPSAEGATVVAVEHGTAAEVVGQNSQPTRKLRIQGYRIRIFFDNGPDARAKSLAAKRTFQAAFAGVPVFHNYENPYFEVSAGNYATHEEAIVALDWIQSKFPEAFLMNKELTAAEIVR